MRIEHPCDLAGRSEKVFVNKGVVIGKEDTEARMRVIPAHNAMVGILLIFDLINVLPGILGECDVGASFFGVRAGNRRLNFNSAGTVLARILMSTQKE